MTSCGISGANRILVQTAEVPAHESYSGTKFEFLLNMFEAKDQQNPKP